MTDTVSYPENESVDRVDNAVSVAREAFRSGRTRELGWRLAQLDGLRRMLTERGAELELALARDLSKSATEAWVTEIGEVMSEIDHTRSHLAGWLRPEPRSIPLIIKPARGEVRLDPLGVVLIVAPWNYPVQLILSPLIGAVAAGNAVIIKPSEVASSSAAALADLLPRYLDAEAVQLVQGGPEEVNRLIGKGLDHVFFTGSTKTGQIVMAAAAEQLTPVTLELGGKSPVYVHHDVDLRKVADRIVWAKLLNVGQTCVAPDYVLVHESSREPLVVELIRSAEKMYGTNTRHNSDYGRLITQQHAQQVVGLLDGQIIRHGGANDVAERYLEFTVVVDPDLDSPLMTEEIFGPILPVVGVSGPNEAIEIVGSKPHPLALYIFSEDEVVVEEMIARTQSGGVSVGAPVVHFAAPDLPFGGVGASGIGRYHGRATVEAFSHHRSVLHKPLSPDGLRLIQPPYTPRSAALIRGLTGGPRALFSQFRKSRQVRPFNQVGKANKAST